MSKIPDTPKSKYNHNDPFRWVDSQWEKFIAEQKELKAKISNLESDNDILRKEVNKVNNSLRKLVFNIPSKLLVDSEDKDKYIYESPDGGETVYRRKFGDYDNKEKIK